MKLIAYDFGASSGRAVLGKYNGERLDTEELWRFSNDPVAVGNTLYWDTLRLLHETKQGLYAAKRAFHTDIAGIGIDTWGVDFGLLDACGELIGNPVHYRDARTTGKMAKAVSILTKEKIYNETGIQFMEINTLYHLMALAEHSPDLLQRAKTLLFTPDLLGYFLTGVKTCERTIASTSQMLHPITGKWSYNILDKLNIPTHMLLPVVEPLQSLGSLSASVMDEIGIGAVRVFTIGGHDTASAVVAVPAEEKGFAYLSSGTWSLMGVELDSPILSELAFNLNVTNEGGVSGTTRLLKNIMGLWILQECKREWDRAGANSTFEELAAAAEHEKQFLCFIDPDAPEFGKPGHMTEKISAFCIRTGQSKPETKAAVVRCILESLAMKYRKTFTELETLTGKRIPVLHVVGGGSRNSLLNSFTAEAINRPVQAGPSEATALGNLASQLIALGELSNLDEARTLVRRSISSAIVLPSNPEIWDDAYSRFEEVLKR